jgi:hypothetical protein
VKRLRLVALVLAASCTGHAPLIVVVPPGVPPLLKPHTYTLPIEAVNTDTFCVQTLNPIYQPCWTVGYLRGLMISVKAE